MVPQTWRKAEGGSEWEGHRYTVEEGGMVRSMLCKPFVLGMRQTDGQTDGQTDRKTDRHKATQTTPARLPVQSQLATGGYTKVGWTVMYR